MYKTGKGHNIQSPLFLGSEQNPNSFASSPVKTPDLTGVPFELVSSCTGDLNDFDMLAESSVFKPTNVTEKPPSVSEEGDNEFDVMAYLGDCIEFVKAA